MRVRMAAFVSVALTATLVLLASCGLAVARSETSFTDPHPVGIEGYSGSAMEPSISPDGQYLLFNTSNVAPNIPTLQFATRVDADTFTYQGEILGEGVNEAGFLSGTPTIDNGGDVYFISTRSYPQTLSTVYGGQFAAGQMTDVHLLPGVSGGIPGIVDFDVAVSPDGGTLYVSVGHFNGGSAPTSATLTMYDQVGGVFVADPRSSRLLRAVNKPPAFDYAASVSSDGLELFFTRANPANGVAPGIYRAWRKSTAKKFAHVQRIAAITGFAEAPSISADGTTLYYHRLMGSQYEIEAVTRP
jgi:WD40-like Beta Propeller Repeat